MSVVGEEAGDGTATEPALDRRGTLREDVADEDEDELIQEKFARQVKAALLREADRIVSKILLVPAFTTAIFNVTLPIDQPHPVSDAIKSKLRGYGFREHPDHGERGSYTLALQNDLPPDLYPVDLWIEVRDNEGLTGWYTMEEDECNTWPVWGRVAAGGGGGKGGGGGPADMLPGAIPVENLDLTVSHVGALTTGDAAGSATDLKLFVTATGNWMIAPSVASEDGWLTSMSTMPTKEVVPELGSGKGKDVRAWGMPHAMTSWTVYNPDKQQWIPGTSSQSKATAVTYVPRHLFVASPDNPALEGSYFLSPAQHNGRPLWKHAHDDVDISVFSLPRGGGWMIGRAAEETGWAAATLHDSSKMMPDEIYGWVLHRSNETPPTWLPSPIKVRRQQFRSPTKIVFRLTQTDEQRLVQASGSLFNELSARAHAIFDEIIRIITEGTLQGRTQYDDVFLMPPGRHEKHVVSMVYELLEEKGIETVVLSQTAHNGMRFTYSVSLDDWAEEEAKAAAETVIAEVRRGEEGSWYQGEFAVPMDVLAQALEELGLEGFFVGQRGRFVVVRVRIPWSTRDVWDHGELRHMHFGYAQMLNPAIQSNRISPSRDHRYVIPTAESKPIWDPRSPEPLPVVKNTTPYTTYTMQPTVDSIVF